jgi:prevent-host-death family protein
MKRSASVVELKARLSEFLRLVKAGHEILITERGVPVARVLPLDESERRSTRRRRLAASGTVKPGHGRLPRRLGTAPIGPEVGAGVLAALLDERGERDR